MSTNVLTMKLGKVMLVMVILPFLFACTKSKFSAVKNNPAPVSQNDQPNPDNPYDNDDNYDDVDLDDDIPDNGCKKPGGCYNPPPPDDGCKPHCYDDEPPVVYDPPVYDPPVYNDPPVDIDYPPIDVKPPCCKGHKCHPYGTPCPKPPPIVEQPPCCNGHACHPYNTRCPDPKPEYACPADPRCPDYRPPVVVQPPCCKGHACHEYGTECPKPPPKQVCKDYTYDYPKYEGPDELFVWVAMDGSKSNMQERLSQLKGMVSMYQKHIARAVPINIGVITGHSPQSSDSAMSGHYFYKHGNEPLIIRFESGKSNSAGLKALESKIMNMRTDNSSGISDGGELLVANVVATLKNIDKLPKAAFKAGSLLNIHFIGDENDICTPGKVASSMMKDPKTGKMVSRELVSEAANCGDVNVIEGKGYSKTAYDLIKELNESGKALTHLTGFIYTPDSKIPKGGQNEIGHGMLQLIQALKGTPVDLASLKGTKAIDAAARKLVRTLNIQTDISLRYTLDKREADLSAIDTRNSYVQVDRLPIGSIGYNIDKPSNTMSLERCPLDGQKIKIHYCRLPEGQTNEVNYRNTGDGADDERRQYFEDERDI